MQGTITQVFETGDFSVWLPQTRRMVMAYGTLCDLSDLHPEPGMGVTVTLDDGKVLSVTPESAAKAAAAFRVA